MTIAAAFNCSNGIILGTDSLVTDGLNKSYENKVFACSPAFSCPVVLMAGAGPFPRIRDFAGQLLDAQTFDETSTITEAKEALRKASQGRWYRDAVKRTIRENWNLECLFVVKDLGAKTAAFHLFNHDLYNIPDSCCIGTGASIARYLTSWLYNPRMPVEVFTLLAFQIFNQAKQFGDGCGGQTHIRQIFDGPVELKDVIAYEVDDSVFLWDIQAVLGRIIPSFINPSVPDGVFDLHLEGLVTHLRTVRAQTKEAWEKQDMLSLLKPPHK